MLATHPKTGKPIRIMKSDASIWKNSKTLLYLQNNSLSKDTWQRYDTIAAGVDKRVLSWNPTIIILTEDSPAVQKWLQTPLAKSTKFILLTAEIVESALKEDFNVSSLGNVMCLEELSIMYPFIGAAWDTTIEDAVICAAIIFRYNRLIGVTSTDRLTNSVCNNISLSISEFSTSLKPSPLVLIQQYYKPKQTIRQKELYKCLKNNLECPYVDSIILFVESC